MGQKAGNLPDVIVAVVDACDEHRLRHQFSRVDVRKFEHPIQDWSQWQRSVGPVNLAPDLLPRRIHLQRDPILDGMLKFANVYAGELVTETMLVAGVNDGDDHVREIAGFLAHLGPARAYLSIPTRPPAEKWVRAPGEKAINRAYQILSESVGQVEYLIGYEGNAFAFTGNVEEDMLSITSVHPMREEAVNEFLARAGAAWPVVRRLIAQGQLIEMEYEGRRFYMRKLDTRHER